MVYQSATASATLIRTAPATLAFPSLTGPRRFSTRPRRNQPTPPPTCSLRLARTLLLPGCHTPVQAVTSAQLPQRILFLRIPLLISPRYLEQARQRRRK